MYRSSRLAALVVALSAFVVVPTAAASTISASGTTITIAGGDESSDISFPGGGEYRVVDTAGATAGSGCEQRSATEVSCGTPSSFTLDAVVADLGAGDDRYVLAGFYQQTVDGGPGDDAIQTGAHGDDLVHGGPGNDTIDASEGSDSVYGDDGDDQVSGGDGSDTIDGGAGRDIISGDYGDLNGDGSDTIAARDGEADQISCGFGADVVTADDLDVTDELCENVDAQAVVPAKPDLALSVKKSASILKATKKPGYGIGLVVGSDGTLTVKLVITAITARRYGLGKKTLVLDSLRSPVKADTYGVGLWASGATARKLRVLRNRRGFTKIPAVITATLVSDSGGKRTQTAKVALTR